MTNTPNTSGATVVKIAILFAILTTIGIAAGAFALSFAALRDLAGKAGQPPDLTWIWPILLDGSILQATVAVVALAAHPAARPARRFFWVVLGVAAAVSVAGNAYHATVSTGRILTPDIAAAMATVAPIALLAATHGLAVLIRAPRDPGDGAGATGSVAGATVGVASAPARATTVAHRPPPSGAHATGHEPAVSPLPDPDDWYKPVNWDVAPRQACASGCDNGGAGGAHEPEEDRDSIILELNAQGIGQREIARRIGVHHSTVQRVLNRADDAPPTATHERQPGAEAPADGAHAPAMADPAPVSAAPRQLAARNGHRRATGSLAVIDAEVIDEADEQPAPGTGTGPGGDDDNESTADGGL